VTREATPQVSPEPRPEAPPEPPAAPAWTPLSGAAHRIALEVLLRGPLPRSELARRLDLSAGTLTRLVRPLLDRGLLVEDGTAGNAARGRPSRPLDVVAGTHHFIGAKITDEDVHVVVTDLRAEVVASGRAPLPGRDPAAVVTTLTALARAQAAGGPRGTAAGDTGGGLVAGHATVLRAPFLGWEEDVPLGARLGEALGLPVVVDNDLLALARAEHWFGTGRGLDRFALLTTGIGVGYAVVMHGRLVESPDAGIGMVSHFPLDPLGPACPEGHRGCATAMLTAPSISAAVSVGRRRETGYEECLDLAAAGEPVAASVVTAAGRALGRLIAAVATLTRAGTVILTGEGIRLAEVARDAVREGLRAGRDRRASDVTTIVRPIDFSVWARGAAVTAIQRYVLGGPV
jgi:predicted NBD/HSP70 family sugar kinase